MINRKNIDQLLRRPHLKKDLSPKLTICTDKEKNLDDIDIIFSLFKRIRYIHVRGLRKIATPIKLLKAPKIQESTNLSDQKNRKNLYTSGQMY